MLLALHWYSVIGNSDDRSAQNVRIKSMLDAIGVESRSKPEKEANQLKLVRNVRASSRLIELIKIFGWVILFCPEYSIRYFRDLSIDSIDDMSTF